MAFPGGWLRRAVLKAHSRHPPGNASNLNYCLTNARFIAVILDLHSRGEVKEFGGYLERAENRKIPFTIIVGIEHKLEYYDHLLLRELDDILGPVRLLSHACGKEYCRYFSLLDEKSRFIAFLKNKIESSQENGDHWESLKLPTPFEQIHRIKELAEKNDDKGFFPDFFSEAGKFTVSRHRKKRRHRGGHKKVEGDSLIPLQFYDLAVACVKHNSRSAGSSQFNVLLIENDPKGIIKELSEPTQKTTLESCLEAIKGLFPGYKLWIYPEKANYRVLKEKLNSILHVETDREKRESEILSDIEPLNADPKPDQQESISSFDNIDLILIDIFLGKDTELSGLEFLRLFTLLYPEIPAFILSVSEDTEIIGKAVEQGADYYILKKNIFSLPYLYDKYINDLGKLINYINDRSLRRSLVGCLRYWRFKKELLWFGDKCYHMINHSYNHAKNVWEIANQILPSLLDSDYLEDNQTCLSDEDIYSFCMAVWLHDIGHKGNEHYGEPHEIRDLHGLISAEIFMKMPESYGISDYKSGGVSPYRWVVFGRPKTAPQLIRERLAAFEASGQFIKKLKPRGEDAGGELDLCKYINKLTILEKIALISIYHKSNFPLDEDDLHKLRRKGKRIPADCYYDRNEETSPIHLKSISDVLNSDNILTLTALFRFVDGIDINQNRVGDNTEEGIKKITIARDVSYQKLKLKKEVERIKERYIKDAGMGKRFFSLFYKKFIEDIHREQCVTEELKREQRRYLDTIGADLPLDNYDMLSDYIQFLSVSDGHYGLHNSIAAVKIELLPPHDADKKKPLFRIDYISKRDKNYLNSKDEVEVKVFGEKGGCTIKDYLLGTCEKGGENRNEDDVGYVRRELNAGRKYLEKWFDVEHSRIRMKHRTEEGDSWWEEELKPK